MSSININTVNKTAYNIPQELDSGAFRQLEADVFQTDDYDAVSDSIAGTGNLNIGLILDHQGEKPDGSASLMASREGEFANNDAEYQNFNALNSDLLEPQQGDHHNGAGSAAMALPMALEEAMNASEQMDFSSGIAASNNGDALGLGTANAIAGNIASSASSGGFSSVSNNTGRGADGQNGDVGVSARDGSNGSNGTNGTTPVPVPVNPPANGGDGNDGKDGNDGSGGGDTTIIINEGDTTIINEGDTLIEGDIINEATTTLIENVTNVVNNTVNNVTQITNNATHLLEQVLNIADTTINNTINNAGDIITNLTNNATTIVNHAGDIINNLTEILPGQDGNIDITFLLPEGGALNLTFEAGELPELTLTPPALENLIPAPVSELVEVIVPLPVIPVIENTLQIVSDLLPEGQVGPEMVGQVLENVTNLLADPLAELTLGGQTIAIGGEGLLNLNAINGDNATLLDLSLVEENLNLELVGQEIPLGNLLNDVLADPLAELSLGGQTIAIGGEGLLNLNAINEDNATLVDLAATDNELTVELLGQEITLPFGGGLSGDPLAELSLGGQTIAIGGEGLINLDAMNQDNATLLDIAAAGDNGLSVEVLGQEIALPEVTNILGDTLAEPLTEVQLGNLNLQIGGEQLIDLQTITPDTGELLAVNVLGEPLTGLLALQNDESLLELPVAESVAPVAELLTPVADILPLSSTPDAPLIEVDIPGLHVELGLSNGLVLGSSDTSPGMDGSLLDLNNGILTGGLLGGAAAPADILAAPLESLDLGIGDISLDETPLNLLPDLGGEALGGLLAPEVATPVASLLPAASALDPLALDNDGLDIDTSILDDTAGLLDNALGGGGLDDLPDLGGVLDSSGQAVAAPLPVAAIIPAVVAAPLPVALPIPLALPPVTLPPVALPSLGGFGGFGGWGHH